MLRSITGFLLLCCAVGCATPRGEPSTPLQLSLFPPAQLAPEAWDVSGLRLTFVYGRNLNLSGLDLGLANEVAQEAGGMQAAALWNSAGSATGAQVALAMNFANEVVGAQVAGIGTNNADNATGIQLAPLGNLATCDISGLQLAGVGNTAGSLAGVQIALMNASQDAHGVQIAPLYNYAAELRGVQFGLFNCCRKTSGVQIGLLNFSLNSPLPFFPLVYAQF